LNENINYCRKYRPRYKLSTNRVKRRKININVQNDNLASTLSSSEKQESSKNEPLPQYKNLKTRKSTPKIKTTWKLSPHIPQAPKKKKSRQIPSQRTLPFCTSKTVFDNIKEDLPDVIESLDTKGKTSSFRTFVRVLANRTLPLSNIALSSLGCCKMV